MRSAIPLVFPLAFPFATLPLAVPFHFIPFHFIGNVCIYTPYSPASSGLSPHSGCLEIAGLLMSCREYGIFVPFSKVSVYRVDDVFEQGLHKCVG